jgi:starvation-inducible DNA-binding protein
MPTTRKSAAPTRTFPTRNDLSEETRATSIAVCNQQLAAAFDLYSQTKQAHWNVKGKDFFQLHELFDDLAEVVLAHVDAIAERATALGGYACGTARMATAASPLPEFPIDATDGMEHVAALVERFGGYGEGNRKAIDTTTEAGDQDTADLFTEISRETDKALWFLEAHLQG